MSGSLICDGSKSLVSTTSFLILPLLETSGNCKVPQRAKLVPATSTETSVGTSEVITLQPDSSSRRSRSSHSSSSRRGGRQRRRRRATPVRSRELVLPPHDFPSRSGVRSTLSKLQERASAAAKSLYICLGNTAAHTAFL